MTKNFKEWTKMQFWVTKEWYFVNLPTSVHVNASKDKRAVGMRENETKALLNAALAGSNCLGKYKTLETTKLFLVTYRMAVSLLWEITFFHKMQQMSPWRNKRRKIQTASIFFQRLGRTTTRDLQKRTDITTDPANIRQSAQPWPRCGKTWHALAQPGQLWASAGSEPASQSWLRPGVNCHCQLWPKTGPRLATGRLGDPLSGTGTELAQTWLNSLSF